MTRRRVALAAVLLAGCAAVSVASACTDGEQRPDVAGSEPGSSGPAVVTGSATASGSESASGPATTQAFSRLDADTLVDVALGEFTIQASQTVMPAGRIYVDVRNRGRVEHEVVVIREGATDEEGAIADTGRLGAGEATTLAVELGPGRYQFACYIRDGEDHYLEGMVLPFEVT